MEINTIPIKMLKVIIDLFTFGIWPFLVLTHKKYSDHFMTFTF